tara:strand:+ start:518 stop:1543 length:1026 start_codon:yes stop_codon:yes gene_type:complete
MDNVNLHPQIAKKEVVMSQINQAQRYTIEVLLKQGISKSEIASSLGKHRSSIYRELTRNSDARNKEYRSRLAQDKTDVRHKEKKKHQRFTSQVKAFVVNQLAIELSPEQIKGLAKDRGFTCVSHETIYQYIWKDKSENGYLYTKLRNKGRKYRNRCSAKDSRGIIKDRVSIEKRPAIVESKKRFGDLEIDTIIGKNHQQAIVTINDRASGMLRMKKVITRDAKSVSQATISLLSDWIPYLKTITSDNGKEFAYHKDITSALNVDFYFARPYHSWERGANENLNGLIRQYFPKKTDLSTITDKQIKEVQIKLNNRPRKRHNYKTPIFVMDKLLFNSDVAFMS